MRNFFKNTRAKIQAKIVRAAVLMKQSGTKAGSYSGQL